MQNRPSDGPLPVERGRNIVYGSYRAVEKVLIGMALAFLAYPASAVIARPDWPEVLRGPVVPRVRLEAEFLAMAVALLGTTITPYMQIFQQSSVVDKGVTRRRYGPERADAYLGSAISNLVSGSIIATAATLFQAGTGAKSAADAARALRPVAGDAAEALFAVGLFGASALAARVLPLATAYAVSETLGLPKGVDLNFRRAPVFLGTFSGLILFAAAIALIPGLPVIDLLVRLQMLNGLLLPFVLFCVLRLANSPKLMGRLKNSLAENAVGWGSLGLISLAAAIYLATQLGPILGPH